MNRDKALRLAIVELRRAARILAFDSAMAEKWGATYAQAVAASRRRKLLTQAAAVIEAEVEKE